MTAPAGSGGAVDKVLTIAELAALCGRWREQGRTVVQSHGIFDVVHPGVVRHLEIARGLGDVLVVTVVGDGALRAGPLYPVFPERLRAANAAALAAVDAVAIVEDASPEASIRCLRPDVFAKGQALTRAELEAYTFLFGDGISEVGPTRIHETGQSLAPPSQLDAGLADFFSAETRRYLRRFAAARPFEEVRERIERLRDLSVLIVGDAIIDEYAYCLPLGRSAKSPIVVHQHLDQEVFAGGALAIANHAAGICREVRLVTLLGEDDPREGFIRDALKPNVRPVFFRRPDGPTIVKRRWIHRHNNQKLFEVNYLNERSISAPLQDEVVGLLAGVSAEHDLVMVCDYGHGFITAGIISAIGRLARRLAVNTQSNGANAGYNMVTKYSRADFICLDETEVRWAAQDRESPIETVLRQVAGLIDCGVLVSTLGKLGAIGIDRAGGVSQAPILSSTLVDTVGAGDAFFAFTAPLVAQGAPLEVVTFVGNAVGALAVRIMGNRRRVEKDELLEFVEMLLHRPGGRD